MARASALGTRGALAVRSLLARPGTHTASPLRQAATPASAAAFADISSAPGICRPSGDALTIAVSVSPGQSAVAVTPVPFSSSASASVSDRTKAFDAA